MKTNVISVSNYRDIIKRKKRLKLEVKLLILKSLIHNKQLNPVIRSVFRFKFLTYWKKIYSFSNQQNICVFSGKKKLHLSYHLLLDNSLKDWLSTV